MLREIQVITDFVLVRKSGHKTTLGQRIPGVGLLDQINHPDYEVIGYEWKGGDVLHYLALDNCDVKSVRPLENGSALVVLQDEKIHGSNNVIILDSNKSEIMRIQNPYASYKEKKDDDKYWFFEMKVSHEEVELFVQVERNILGKYSSKFEPWFSAKYNVSDWSLKSFQWIRRD